MVLVNKADTAPEEAMNRAVEEIRALDCSEVYPIVARRRKGYPQYLRREPKGRTITVVGSSGVGKSTFVNSLLSDEWLGTGHVNEVTGKGRHTTVARELVILVGGGVLIDNPGMREIHMWTDAATLRAQFADLKASAALPTAPTARMPAVPSVLRWRAAHLPRSATSIS